MSGNTIKIWQDFDAFETCVLSEGKNLILDGNNCTINNKNWGKTIFQVAAGSTLEIKNLKIDGGATTWKIDYENAYIDGNYARIPTKNYESEKKATASTIKSNGNLIASNLTIQNILMNYVLPLMLFQFLSILFLVSDVLTSRLLPFA